MEQKLAELLNRIALSDAAEIDSVITAASQRYRPLHPDWEIAILTLPKEDAAKRCQILTRVLEYEQMRREGQ